MAKLTTSQAAKILGIHPDTLRRRAKAGKVKFTRDVNGHMSFDEADLKAEQPIPSQVNTTKVIFVIDESSSMMGWTGRMDEVIHDQVKSFLDVSSPTNKFEITSIRFASTVSPATLFNPVESYSHVPSRARGNTALYDALNSAIDLAERVLNDTTSALIIVFTDGQENNSYTSEFVLQQRIARAVKTDRITIAVNCPPGGDREMTKLGISPGNVRVWERTTAGFDDLKNVGRRASMSYGTTRSLGITSTSTYYANVAGDSDKAADALKANLVDVTKSVQVERVGKDADGQPIRKFAERKFGAYTKGTIFYQLVKKEKVQEYKQIIVQDNKTGKFFAGWDAARKLLGLPMFQIGEIKIAPGSLGDFSVYIQSTSYNRKLEAGTAVVKFG